MATLVLDTHKAIARLKKAGFEESKAEAIIESLQEVEFVTKQDLETALTQLESRLYKWGFTALLAQAALIVALIELLGS